MPRRIRLSICEEVPAASETSGEMQAFAVLGVHGQTLHRSLHQTKHAWRRILS